MNSLDLFSLKGRRALITGSSKGIGLAIAKGLAGAGADIVLNGRDAKRLETAAAEMEKQGFTVYTSAFDVCDQDRVGKALEQVEKDAGPVDILVNNAGINLRNPFEDYELEDWDRMMNVNLKGAFIVSQAFGRRMIERKAGKIINICSMQSELGRPTITPYAATKGGLKMLTKGMATEWGKHNIQVNGLGPGYFVTDLTRPLVEDEKFNAWLCSRTPANRWGDPDELIGAAVFLASAASNYVNGHILYVDGGMLGCV